MIHAREAVVALAVCLLASCAPARAPFAEIAQADVAVHDAERADAASYASFELQQARYKVDDAKRAADDRDNVRARRLAEEALVDARLAETKAQLGKANATLADLRARGAAQGRSRAGEY
jgi:Domain of unknown function (DUF4398)